MSEHSDRRSASLQEKIPSLFVKVGVLMRALTVDCVTCRRLAAATKLPVAATIRKVRASSVSMA